MYDRDNFYFIGSQEDQEKKWEDKYQIFKYFVMKDEVEIVFSIYFKFLGRSIMR